MCVIGCMLPRETLTRHVLTTCDFLLRRFTFQKKIQPHIYQQRRLQVSKKDFFSPFQRLIMYSYKHTGNATVLKYTELYNTSILMYKTASSIFDQNIVICVFNNLAIH